MNPTARTLALIAATAMLIFSAWMYLRTGDWVALVFIAGSLGYIALFVSTRLSDKD
ncbi:MAG: hypothetical protein AB8C02_06310 [Halioglobus sp.]